MQISISSITTIIFFLTIFISQPPLTHSLNQEGLYLQTLKTSLSDPTNALSTWDPRHDSPCNWTGILCDPKTTSVVSIDLSSSNLNGPFPLILCRLHSLTFISFNDNYINSTLPPEISQCRSLKHLDLQMNYLVGTLPDTLPLLPELEYLDLSGNNFTGDVPRSFATFPKLKVFSLLENLITGEFPVFMFNVTSLTTLNASFNPMTPSRLTSEIDKLVNLECLWVANCSLIGDLPDSMRRLTKLQVLDVSYNQLSGKFPRWITEMVSLRQVEFYGNSFTGELPESGWEKMTSLRNFDASMNRIAGTIPEGLARLPLKSFNMYENQLEGEIPKFIGESPNLEELKLYSNKLTGELPRKLGENSPLIIIDISTNKLTGELPPNLCKQVKLTNLLLMDNLISGEIPSSYGECVSLIRVRLGNNRLTGSVPEKFWGLPHMSLLELMRNSLSGEISKSIAFASNLSIVRISDNSFSGEIPEEIGNATNMRELMANNNKLSGSIPESMMKLEQLANLNFYNNDLSGEIPSEIKSKALSELSLGSNKLSGRIPSEFGSLMTLNYLDLSNNKLTGEVPNELQHLRLNDFNFSNNQLSGELPSFFAKRIYKESFLGNPGLCGDIEGLCDSRVEVKKQRYLWLLRSIFIVAAIVFIVGVVWFYFKYRSFKDVGKCTNDKSKWTLMSFHKLGFSEYEILDCLDEDNVIGTGASGKVYKAVLSNGEAVAVKKLWSHMNKVVDSDDIENGGGGGGGGGGGEVKDNGFEAEVDTLGKIRHKNIVRLWCCCKTKDCKLLVYEYMPNGSLGDLLHGPKGGLLDWPTRYRIALDSAEGLSYLHHDCVPAIVHRDIKSNNILLDGEFGAKVADFGVAKVVDAIGKGTKSMSVIAGSCGYIAPEYAYTLRVNEKSDTYSFGVVILELVTGKRPVDPEYGEKDLVKWVCTTMDQKGVDHIIDPKLDSCYKEEVCKLLNIGLLCTSPLPINRPSMRRVVKMLQEISGEDILKTGKKDGKLTPYYYEEASDQGSAV